MKDEQAGDEVWNNETGWKLLERVSPATWLAEPLSDNVRKWGPTIIDPSVCVNRTASLRSVKAKLEAAKADPINHPPHYVASKIEPIDVIEAWGLSFCLGNVVKYIARAGKKDPGKLVEDLKKAAWYLAREIEQLEREKDSK